MIDSKILQRALDWNMYPKGIRIFLDTEVSSIQNTEVRDAILLDEKKQALAPKFYRGKKRKTWYDSSTNAIHVILSNIESPRELDRVILNEVLLRRGLAGLVGDDVMNRIANAVFDGQDEQTRKTFLSYVLGNNDMETDRIAAGKLYLRSQANQYAKAVTSQSKENAGKAWYSMVRKYIRPYAPQLFSFLSEETSLSHIIGAGIRAHAFYDSYSAKMSEVSSSRVRDEIVKLYNRELEGRTLALGRYIHLGRPGDILLASAPWTKTCPVILPLVSLYENMEDGRHERYITSVEDIKKEKHPFSLLQVLNLRDELESPLAVFKSVKRDRGLVIMLPSKGGKTADASKMEHFAVPISLQEINYTENSGLRKSYGSGKWVNYIHSIYPKNDSGYLCWLSVPGLCSYLSPSFEEKWLKPAETRLEERFEHLFKAEGIKKPSAGEIKEILNNLSADDYIDIKSKLAKFQDLNEAGLPKVYSVYRDVLESATKIVKEFENPKIISQKNIEFSIQDEDLSPRMMMEKVLGEFMKNNPEKLRRIAYLCVKGSPAFGNELPPVNPVSYVADMQYGELKETIMEHWQKLSEDARISIHAEFPELPNLSLDENIKYEDARKLFFTLTLDDKCRFMGFDGKNDAWKDLMNWHPLGGPDWKLDEDMLLGGIDDMFKQATTEEVIEKYIEWKNDGFKASETYALAKDITMFMVNKLNEHGIKTVMVPEEKAREILEKERGSEGEGLDRADFSVRDIMNLSYTWNGEDVSMRGFAEQFMSEIKQKDRTMEDAERIAKAFIEAVKADPEKAGMKMLKAENMANAFRFKLPDGTIYTPEHPLASSPEYETQRGLWLIYENVLGRETMNEFVGLLSKKAPMSAEERKRYSELESKVNGSDLMQRSLEVPASKVNENRVRDIRNLIQYFEGNEDYTWTEKALIVKGAMSFGYSEKKEPNQTKVEIKNISDNNSVAVPVIGGDAAAVVEGLRKGLNFKDALIQARISLSKESKRSVERNFTGWKVYKQSNKEEDAAILNQDVAGTGWCTGGAVSTARSHLSGGDFHVYFEAGEPLIAIRTNNGHMAEPPRGAHEGQFCTSREEQIAFDYIRGGNGIVAGDDYIADIEDIRRIMSPDATPLDAFLLPVSRRYENGEYGGDTSAWGDAVERRIAELIPEGKEERWKLGLYYSFEIEEACRNGYIKAIKGEICLTGSASLTIPEGVTQVGNIELCDSASLILPEGVTQVGNIVLYNSASLYLLEGVTQFGNIFLHGSASLTIPEGVTQVENISLYDYVFLTLPKGITQVGNIFLYDSASLTLPEGVTQVGDIVLHNNASLTLPEGVTQVGNIFLYDSASLTIPEGVTQVGNIELCDSASLTLPEGVMLVGNIGLSGSASLTLPKGVTMLGNIRLDDSTSLALPKGVTQIGDICLFYSTSLTLPEGVTQVGNIFLYDSASMTIPEGVTQVGNIELCDSASLTIPKGVTQVGNIDLYGSSSLTLPEGVMQVGSILLSSGTSITFPDGFVLRNESYDRMHYSAKKINEILSEHQKKTEFRLSNGTIYGYQLGDTIYLTPIGINPNTPIHEYAHLWAKVYEKLRPDEWESLKEELKALPQWKEIAESESYSFIESDENRLAGEVLATIVGNKGEELMLTAARDTLKEGERTDESVVKGAEYFRQKVTDMAVKDVFDAEGMERTGEVTLKVLKDFAEGKGVKVSKEEGKKLAAMAEFERNRVKTTEYISKSNARFNEELQKQIDGEFDSEPHTYNLGYPGPILRSTGIPNLPIQVTSTKLYEKSNSYKHKYALDEIKDLVKHINTPVAVFSYGDGTLAQNIIIDIEHDNSHFLVGMSLNAHIKGSALEINSIRNIFPKDNYKWMEWIQEGKSRYMDKEKIKVLIAQQRTSSADVNHLDLDFVANIVEKFENPKVDENYFIIDNWQYYGVFLDDRAQSIIDREFRELIPPGWRKHADHVTVLYNDYSNDMIAKGRSLAKTLGQERTMRIVALGKSDTAIALMVEGVETENKIAHITLATSPDGKPVDSNLITEWKPVGQIDISGRLGLSYKGKKYFEVLSDNDVFDFQINKNNMAKQVHQQSSEKKDATVAISGLMKDADFKTLQKAALFAAWETREDNPYEFVVDMSRNELAEFLSNAEKELNDEDRDIVSKILSHEPGYGEDYVEKQISFRPDIETLLVDDLTVGGDVLDRAFFYRATKDMNDAQLQQLRDNVRKKAVDFYSNMDKKNDLPGHKDTEKFVDKQLHSWFRPWTRLAGKLEHQLDEIHMSDSGPVSLKDIETTARDAMADPAYANYINRELIGWIYNRCCDYGLDYTKLPGDLQREELVSAFKREWSELVTTKEVEILQGIKNGSDIVIRKEGNYTIPADVTELGNIALRDNTFLAIPESVTQVGSIVLSDSASMTLPEGVTQVGGIVLSDSASLTIPEGVTQVGNIVLRDNTSLTIPEGVTQVGKIGLFGSASLTLPEGLTQVGSIILSDSASLTIPEGVTHVGNIWLRDNTSLSISKGVTQVGDIKLFDSTSLTLPKGVTHVGNIWLRDNTSLRIPKGVTQMGKIELFGSASLILPKGATQVGDIELHDYTSLTIPEGVTQVGGIVLSDSTSLTLPEGVTQMGSIYLFDSSSLTTPEGVTQVGNILLRDNTSLILPKGVTQVGDIELHDYTSLTIPEGVTQVGDIELWKSASLTLPEGVTQVGHIHLSSGTSITFPDGYVLHTEENKTFSPEEFNALLAEHQIEHQMNIKAALDKKSTVAKAMYKKNYDTLTRDAILAHIDKITALYPQYPQEPTKVSLKPDGSIVRQYGEFEYEQIKGGFERSKNLVLVEELDGEPLQRKALYSMSSDSYGEHPNGPYVRFWDNGNIRSYENCSVRVGSDNEFESDMLSFTREGIVQEIIPGDYPIEPFLEDITNEYMKTMTKREGLESNATANKIDSALLSTWFISLTLEDKMRVFGYYHYNPENENSPIGFLESKDDIEKLEAAYKEAVEAPHDVPEVEEIVIRKGIEERLASAFESLSYDSKGQIYRETVESGIPGLNQTQRSILNDAHTAKMSEELKTLAIECAARKSFLNGFDYDIGVLNTEKMSDSELYSFVSKNLSVLSIEQLAEAQRILEKWRGIHGMMHENDTIDKRFSKYFAPHCEAVLERTGLDLNELHQSLPQKEFARLIRGQEVLIDGTVNTKEGPSNGLWSFRISPAKPGPDNPGFSFYLYPVEYHDGPNGKIPEHKTLPKGEDLVIKGRHFKAGSDEVEQWRLAGRGIVLETPSGLELVTPGKYDSTVGIARSVSYIEKRLTSLEHADLHLRPFKDDGSIKKEKTKGFQIGGEDIPKLARGEEVVLTTKDGVKACVRYDCGENNLIEVVPFAIAKRMELRDELKQKDKVNLEKVIKEVGRPASKNLDNNIRKK